MAVFGPQQQLTAFAKGFRPAPQATVADLNGDVPADGFAMRLPLIGDFGELPVAYAHVIVIQFTENGRGQVRARHGPARFNFQ